MAKIRKTHNLCGVLSTFILAALGSACTGDVTGDYSAPEAQSLKIVNLQQPLDITFAGSEARLATDAEGRVHSVYAALIDEKPRLVYRTLEPTLGEPITISPAGLDIKVRREVLPVFAILPDDSRVVAYPVSLPGKRKGELRYQRSVDGGLTWSDPELVHDDVDNYGAHNFLDGTAVGKDSLVFSWLDNRTGGQGLRVTRLGAEGMEPNQTADPVTCQCCNTAVLASEDHVWVAYRDLAEGDIRDISLVSSDDAGVTFSEPRPVSADGWKIQGCPHTGPRMVASSPDNLSVVWFSGAGPAIYVASSVDGGGTFGPRQEVAAPKGDLQAAVHPDIGQLADGRLIVVYEVSRRNERSLEARIADSLGKSWADPIQVAGPGTYPRLTKAGERTLLSFTRRVDESAQVLVRELRNVG